jgi:hypothetical protein
MGTLKGNFENVFENLGVVSTPLKCFHNWFLDKRSWKMEEKGVGGFTNEITRVYLGSINPCNHITLVWDGA